MRVMKRIFGTRNDRLIRGYQKKINIINELGARLVSLSDQELAAKTGDFKTRLSQGETLTDILPEAFAVVREAAGRTLGMRHFDVQFVGGMALNDGKIAEMRTGEGKTLVATLPAYLNALTGKGVHVVTVNDYLAERDANWMRPVYEFLGLTVGINLANMSHEEKQAAYAADITYGTNNEYGFDYLRDNMVFEIGECVQRPLNFAIIDEVDSILIDEARTPLIISGQAEESSDLYQKVDKLIPQLTLQELEEEFNPLDGAKDIPEDQRGDYTVDKKNQQAYLTEQGHQTVEKLLAQAGIIQAGESLYDLKNITTMHYVNAALRAHAIYKKDVDYVVKDDEVVIVDEHTGRMMVGRRWSEGLHQAVEAKEGVTIQLENQTLASITFQNYFRLYEKLSGMTGTADTEAFEFQNIYGLETVIIPTNKPMVRDDRSDVLFVDQPSKYKAIADEIKKCNEKQQPVLVGTASVESSELLSHFLKERNIKHEVLNAKQHEREAKIIAQAGMPGAVTISTSMAGRGTDIVLGGNVDVEIAELDDPSAAEIEKHKQSWQERNRIVLDAGGLHVLCTERHESRRIDNQLRGRAGRQGDAGSSQFYLAIDDHLLQLNKRSQFAADFMRKTMKEGEMLQAGMLTKSIRVAQKQMEGHNFDIRKSLLEFDDVANDQRKVIYQQRRQLIEAEDLSRTVNELREEAIETMVEGFMPAESIEDQWDIVGLENQIRQDFNMRMPAQSWLDADSDMDSEGVVKKIVLEMKQAYTLKMSQFDLETNQRLEKGILLQCLDTLWKDHLAAMEHLRQGIHLRGYAQKNPKQEFKRESFEMFQSLLEQIKYEFASMLVKFEIADDAELPEQQPTPMNLHYQHMELDGAGAPQEDNVIEFPGNQQDQAPFRRNVPKVGRNEPCPCGSGKKYKQCCGKLA